LVGKSSDTSGEYEWDITLNSGVPRVTIYSDGLSTSKILRNFDTSLILNQWVYLCFTYDGSGTINGLNAYNAYLLDNSASSGVVGTYNGVAYTNSPLRIARDENGSEVFNGIIDELCIWKNRVLTASEIEQIYNINFSGSGIS